MNLERIILKSLLENDKFVKLVLPYLKEEYFGDTAEKRVFKAFQQYFVKYNVLPTVTEMSLELEKAKDVNQDGLNSSRKVLEDLANNVVTTNYEWLVDNTEKFCRERAIYMAMLQSMQILEGKDNKHTAGQIPTLLSDALAICFDPDIGHDYLENSDAQYDFYHLVENRVRFDLQKLNEITNGGLPEAGLTVLLAGVHVGKTLGMCHMAAGFLSQGYDVLYITLEMGQKHIVQRIDANLLDIPINELESLSKADYDRKVAKNKAKFKGKLIVKEYPTTTASSLHFRSLLDELNMKKGFKPQVVFVDYLNLCASSRYKHGGAGMYEYVKAVAEELRGLAGIYKTRVVTATQVNREGFKSSDPDMTNTAESFGLPATADLMLAMVTNENLEKLNQIKFIQLKNRYGDKNKYRAFLIGVERMKMRLYDVQNSTEGLAVPRSDARPDTSKFQGIKV